MMKVEYINPFLQGALSVLETVLGERPTKGDMAVQVSTLVNGQCSVVCGVTGAIQGQVIYAMSFETADKIASTMLGAPIAEFDSLAASAIGELGNMITGSAMQAFSTNGWICDITPPTIVRGSDLNISTLNIPAILVTLNTNQGDLILTIGLQARK